MSPCRFGKLVAEKEVIGYLAGSTFKRVHLLFAARLLFLQENFHFYLSSRVIAGT
jgi:hypothetical protein